MNSWVRLCYDLLLNCKYCCFFAAVLIVLCFLLAMFLERKCPTGEKSDKLTYKDFAKQWPDAKFQPPLSNYCSLLPKDQQWFRPTVFWVDKFTNHDITIIRLLNWQIPVSSHCLKIAKVYQVLTTTLWQCMTLTVPFYSA